MKRFSKIPFLFFLFLSLVTQAQKDDSSIPETALQRAFAKGKYYKFISTRDSASQSYLFTGGIKYQATAYSKSFSSNGHYVSMGLNLARCFSKKFVLGAFIDLRPLNGFFYIQPQSKIFRRDFESNFNYNYSSQQDSATAHILKKDINGGAIAGGTFGSWGIMFSLFPNKYGGILLSFKSGSESHRISNVYGNKFIKNGEADNLYFDFRYYSYEISFKPYAFFNNGFVDDEEDSQKIIFFKLISCSLFYEKVNIKDASINGLAWKKIQSESFISKYGVSDRFGFSIGLTLY